MKSIKDKILSETPESVIQKVRETTNELVEQNIISDWLEKNRNPEIDKQVEMEAKQLSKQEIKLEDVFNDKKRQGAKELIDKHKQETLEEAAEKSAIEQMEAGNSAYILGFIECAKWQAKRMYSEEEVRLMLWQLGDALFNNCQDGIEEGEAETYFDDIIEQFKKK